LRSSPQAENFCVEVRIWGVNCFLAAYRHDCSIRLFDSVEGSESSGERLCRELICHRIDPYKKTKKRKSQLVAMALDRDFIGCLLHMVDDTSEEDNHILTVLSRDSFLMDDDSNSDVAQVIDIRQSVLNFLLSCDDVDHGLLQLHDFLSNDGDLDDIDVVVSQSLVECGYGRFIVEVAIAVPSSDLTGDQDSVQILLFRKLFLFSTSIGAITWMSDSGPSSTLLGSLNEEMTLSSICREENGRYGYDIVSLSCMLPAITSLSVDSAGTLVHSSLIQGTDSVRNEILVDNWSLRRSRKRPILMLNHEIVVADNLVCDENKAQKAMLTFYPMDNNNSSSVPSKLDLVGNLEVCHLIALRRSHVVAICRASEPTPDANDVDEVAGHWFGPALTIVVSSCAIVIDLQSRSEIHRCCFVDDVGLHLGKNSMGLSTISDGELPIKFAVQGDTVVAGLSSKGIILTGADARKSWQRANPEQEGLTSPSKNAKKAKKKKLAKKNGKKDGFARGQKM